VGPDTSWGLGHELTGLRYGEGDTTLRFDEDKPGVSGTALRRVTRKAWPHAVTVRSSTLSWWRFINERRAVNLDPNCGCAHGKADILCVADAFEVMRKVNEILS
jgi:electron transfer flavoprotein alpha subunit